MDARCCDGVPISCEKYGSHGGQGGAGGYTSDVSNTVKSQVLCHMQFLNCGSQAIEIAIKLSLQLEKYFGK